MEGVTGLDVGPHLAVLRLNCWCTVLPGGWCTSTSGQWALLHVQSMHAPASGFSHVNARTFSTTFMLIRIVTQWFTVIHYIHDHPQFLPLYKVTEITITVCFFTGNHHNSPGVNGLVECHVRLSATRRFCCSCFQGHHIFDLFLRST